MKLDAIAQPLTNIFTLDGPEKYVVPRYQRNYSWGDTQIETLFNDINNEDSGYYVGNLIVDTSHDYFSVIDGQQRLTTISLLLLGIYANMERISAEKRFLLNTKIVFGMKQLVISKESY
ncbi:DNAse/DNA nickase specific for phosphorothioated or glycosylated phage DNA [Fructobacillus tropaeoli]|uniref:DUF262 domain-containing protein n=1 Tax=Fructobacillus tropaeoli TaxID=709323 RepID=UPI002D86D9E1|nr:DNAse/DNA nickase specific for phosphorothioated or glycosylated phage DNA [Fructobacillus tropaeoli]